MAKQPMADAKLYWARRDTRWDPYPQQEPVQLVLHDWYGVWRPLRNGGWFLTPESMDVVADAYAPALFGEWVEEDLPYGGKAVPYFQRR